MVKTKTGGREDVKKALALEFVARQEQEKEKKTEMKQKAIALMAYAFLLEHPEENFT